MDVDRCLGVFRTPPHRQPGWVLLAGGRSSKNGSDYEFFATTSPLLAVRTVRSINVGFSSANDKKYSSFAERKETVKIRLMFSAWCMVEKPGVIRSLSSPDEAPAETCISAAIAAAAHSCGYHPQIWRPHQSTSAAIAATASSSRGAIRGFLSPLRGFDFAGGRLSAGYHRRLGAATASRPRGIPTNQPSRDKRLAR